MELNPKIVDLQQTQLKGRGSTYYSVQVYDTLLGNHFSPTTHFDKWAAVAASVLDTIPKDMEKLIVLAGKYAVFNYKGPMAAFGKLMQQILNHWLPKSGFQIADRPHFEILTDKYLGPLDVNSEEEVWIPIM